MTFQLNIVLLILSISLFACTNHSISPPDTITTIISAPVTNLNPLSATDANSQHINELIHISLMKASDKLTPEPYLAKKFQIINSTTLEFELPKGCLFHNGREITTDDIQFTIALYSDEKTQSPFQKNFQKIVKFEKINNYKFRLHTAKPAPSLPNDLTILKILPKENLGIGAGPFRLVKQNTNDISLERFHNQCTPYPQITNMKIKVVRDDLSRYLKLKNGEIDIILNELNFRKIETINNNPSSNLQTLISDGIGYNYIGINMREEKLRDPRVRLALAHSLNIPEIIQYKSKGLASPAKNILPDLNWYANTNSPSIKFDPEKARELLDQAGYFNTQNNKPPLEITLKTTTNPAVQENARAITEYAKKVGIIIHHRPFEWSTFYADVKAKNTQLYLLRWVGVIDPNIYFENFHSGEIPRGNRTSYASPELDKILEEAESTMDLGKRKKLYLKVQEILAKDLPYISLWHNKNTAAFRKNISNVKLFPTGSWETFLYLKKE